MAKFSFISTMVTDPWGGSEELWSQAALRLHKEGHQVSASVAWWPQPSPRIEAISRAGIELSVRRQHSFSLSQRVWRKLERQFHAKEAAGMQWLRKSAPDLVVVSQGGNLDGLEWMSNCNKAALPYVSIVQCNHEGWWIEDNLAISAAKAYQNAKKVYCVSNHNLELLEYQIGESLPQAKVVWNPFNISTTQPPAWPEMKGTCKLACVARLDPAAKGHDVLFEVLALPEWRSRNIELNLYGKGKHEQVLRKLATKLKLNNVYFRGHVSNINEIWGENHLLVLASRFEGLPLALVETMYCERPAVVTDIGGNAELCVENETGFIANAPKAVLFAQAMERAWDRRDAWQTMGKTARKRIEGLVPKDPVADFCKDLVNCAGKNRS